jgi:hypothetical protein
MQIPRKHRLRIREQTNSTQRNNAHLTDEQLSDESLRTDTTVTEYSVPTTDDHGTHIKTTDTDPERVGAADGSSINSSHRENSRPTCLTNYGRLPLILHNGRTATCDSYQEDGADALWTLEDIFFSESRAQTLGDDNK